MRMWMVPPQHMCRQHLLGEHVEIHMLVGSLSRNKSIQGFIDKGLIEPMAIVARHDEIVQEMSRRGYNHRSPLPRFITIPRKYFEARVDVDQSWADLIHRCDECCDLAPHLNKEKAHV